MKIILKAHVEDPLMEASLENALEWLCSWYESSWGIPDKYRNPETVKKILSPLLRKFPYKENKVPLYRIVTSNNIPQIKVTIPAGKVLSTTSGDGESFWKSLADQIGALDQEYAYVVDVTDFIRIFDTDWVIEKVIPYVADKPKGGILKDLALSYQDQKEVVGYTRVKVDKEILMELKGAQ